MKRIITLVVMLISMIGATQTEIHDRGFNIFFLVGQDIKMAYEGPYAGKSNDIGPTFNPEFKFGLEWKRQIVSLGIEFHNEIHYTKYFGQFGHKFNEPILPLKVITFGLLNDWKMKNFSFITSGEVGIINRDNQNTSFTNPNHYRDNDYCGSYGANLELIYYIPNTHLAVSTNYNVFKAENKDAFGNTITKDFRQDVMFNVYLIF